LALTSRVLGLGLGTQVLGLETCVLGSQVLVNITACLCPQLLPGTHSSLYRGQAESE